MSGAEDLEQPRGFGGAEIGRQDVRGLRRQHHLAQAVAGRHPGEIGPGDGDLAAGKGSQVAGELGHQLELLHVPPGGGARRRRVEHRQQLNRFAGGLELVGHLGDDGAACKGQDWPSQHSPTRFTSP